MTPLRGSILHAETQAVAEANLGEMYSNGSGVPQDYAQAVAWYRKAADQGTRRGTRERGVAWRMAQSPRGGAYQYRAYEALAQA